MLWLTRQGTVEAFSRKGSNTSLLAQQLDGHLTLANSLRTTVRVCLSAISYAVEALRELVRFFFVTHLLRGRVALVCHGGSPPDH